MVLSLLSTWLLVFIIALLFKNLNFVYSDPKKLLLDTLDTSFSAWITALFIYTFFLNLSIENISSIDRSSYLLVNILATIIAILLNSYLYSEIASQYIKIIPIEKKIKKKMTISVVIFSVAIFISTLIYSSSVWLIDTFGNVTIDQLLYSIQTLSGSNTEMVFTYINGPLITTLFIVYLFIRIALFILRHKIKFLFLKRKIKINKKTFWFKFATPILSIAILFFSVFLSLNQVGIAQVTNYFKKSSLIEKEYADPKKVKLTFPEKKRNLIYIFAESMESSYTSKSIGGAQKEDLLTELTQLIDDEIIVNFSNTNKIGGAMQLPGTEYTAAGIVAQTSGMPLKVPQQFAKPEDIDGFDYENEFGMDDNYSSGKSPFLPGLTSLGDILKQQNYNQTFIMGSDATFGGRRAYLSQHGNYGLVDLFEARKKRYIPSDYNVWWGYEDEKVFSIAQKEVTDLASKNKPFNLTMLTSDTHFPEGYATDKTPKKYDNQYSDVISYSSKQIADFVAWCQKQPFYENTTIVISGDHLTMAKDFIENYPEDYERTVFNLVINAPVKPINSKNRQFSTLDMFPTTLASLGVTIPTDRLGIGTNLFSDRETIIEKYSVETIREELAKQSKFYTQNILKIKDKQKAPTSSSTKKSEKKEKTESVPPSTSKPEETTVPSSETAVTDEPLEPVNEEQFIQEEFYSPEFEQ